MRLFYLLPYILTILFSLTINAQHYRDVHRLDKAGWSMEHVKSRTQYYEICYAHTASDIIDAYRFSSGDRRYRLRTSPLYSAIIGTLGRKKLVESPEKALSFEYGNICYTVNKILRYGFKDFKQVDKRIFQNVLDGMVLSDKEVNQQSSEELYELSQKIKDYFRNSYSYYTEFNLKHDAETIKKFRAYQDKNSFWKNKDGLLLNESIYKSLLSQNNYLLFLKQMFDRFAIETHKLKNKKMSCKSRSINKLTSSHLFKKISAHFNKRDDLPIGIDFCNSLLAKNVVGRNDPECNRHAANIIGRRYNQKERQLEVLIKNSEPCSKLDDFYKNKCEEGHKVWVSLGKLILSAFSVHILK